MASSPREMGQHRGSSTEYPRDEGSQADVARLSPQVQRFFSQLTSQDRAESPLFTRIKQLVNTMRPCFLEEPASYKELWRQRRDEFLTLEAVVALTTSAGETDCFLLAACVAIASQKTSLLTDLFLWSAEWNNLPKRIKTLLRDPGLKMTLIYDPIQPESNERSITKYRQLLADYFLLYKKVGELRSPNSVRRNGNTQRQVSYYLNELTRQQRVIDQEVNHKLELTRQRDTLQSNSDGFRQQVLQCRGEIQRLSSRIQSVIQEKEATDLRNKDLEDQNTLLRLQVERLSRENRQLQGVINKKNDDLTREKTNASYLERDVVQLRTDLSLTYEQLAARTRDYQQVLSHLYDFRSVITTTADIELFKNAALENEVALKVITDKIFTLLDELERRIQTVEPEYLSVKTL